MPHDPYKALYIHIPFCVSRCNYCDFFTQAIDCESSRIDKYFEEIISDVRKHAKEGELSSITSAYIGGGTPTHVGSRRLTSLLYALSVSLDLTQPAFEFTIEANPESLNERLVQDMWAMGVNRLSVGIQSLDDDILRFLGRAHSATQALEALGAAKSRFENVSADVICGIPGQSEKSLEETISKLIEQGITHMSVYPLAIEPNTPLDKLVLSGQIDEPSEEMQANHMLLAQELLQHAGFVRYEVANYALPGFESKHNTTYWTGVPYLGVGQGAATMTQNSECRMRVCNGVVTDELNLAQMEAEDLMLGMRLSRGISKERISTSRTYLPSVDQLLNELIKKGYLTDTGTHFAPTQQGWLCGNDLYSDLLNLA